MVKVLECKWAENEKATPAKDKWLNSLVSLKVTVSFLLGKVQPVSISLRNIDSTKNEFHKQSALGILDTYGFVERQLNDKSFIPVE
ncbi:hypothetical protein [Spirosoma panaciterrae]|uniref:hypothetical protein n=1 Tax=Spirosoma panaciterrae TaxID=496058 RepID=UPI00035FB9C0|nr:hypothetical protein [Spirosoma panaciterrae]